MPSQYIKDTYYKGGYRYVINGIPCRFEHPQSKHQLAVRAGQSNTKLLKEAEAIRHPQTTYGPAQDCVFNVEEGVGKNCRPRWRYIHNTAQSAKSYITWEDAKKALTKAQAENEVHND